MSDGDNSDKIKENTIDTKNLSIIKIDLENKSPENPNSFEKNEKKSDEEKTNAIVQNDDSSQIKEKNYKNPENECYPPNEVEKNSKLIYII